MAFLVTLRPGLSPHVRSSPPATQEVGFANTTTLGSSPSFYADPIVTDAGLEKIDSNGTRTRSQSVG
ncbi:hypothetical protein Fmac_011664 [Flemingia macrophylla]|uniref:Uncharacterized protein n=1 Tax=Flemingia macrophylla TaxID=520843 RepID=A0ABD1MNW8_9FABA